MPVKKITATLFQWTCAHGDATGTARTRFDAEKALNKHLREVHGS